MVLVQDDCESCSLPAMLPDQGAFRLAVEIDVSEPSKRTVIRLPPRRKLTAAWRQPSGSPYQSTSRIRSCPRRELERPPSSTPSRGRRWSETSRVVSRANLDRLGKPKCLTSRSLQGCGSGVSTSQHHGSGDTSRDNLYAGLMRSQRASRSGPWAEYRSCTRRRAGGSLRAARAFSSTTVDCRQGADAARRDCRLTDRGL